MSAFRTVRLGELVVPVKSWSPERDDPDGSFTYIDLGAVDQEAKAITGARQLACADAPSRARQLIRTDDILVSTVRPNLNAVARVPRELDGATASTGFCVVRPRADKLHSGYLHHWVRSSGFVDDMVRLATGASYPAVSERVVLDSKLPLPPLPEQWRIAEILDKSDTLRIKRSAALAQLDTLTQSVFMEMFGDPIANSRQFPTRSMIELIDITRPISYGILMPGPDQIDGVKYVRVVDMQDGGIALSGIRKTTEAISNAYRRSLLKPGDLLMSIRGHVGRFAVVPAELDGANITQDTARLAIVGANPVFVRECLRTRGFQRWMAKHTKGVAVRGINLTDVKRMPIILPPAAEQQKFAERTNAASHLKSLERAAYSEVDSLFASLQHRAFRGNL